MAQTKLKSQLFNAPLKGLNLVKPPYGLDPEEAISLDNYYIYDSGIRERGAATDIGPLADAGNVVNMYGFTSVALNKQYVLLSSSATNIYLYDGSAISAWHAGTNFSGATAFNKKVILPTGSTAVDTFDVATGGRTAGAFTTSGNSIGSFVYRDRVYFWNNNSSIVDYGGVGEISHVGALASFDLGQVFQKGQNVIFGTSWSYNQGQINSDLWVIGNEAGEIIIYSGDYPAAANWSLVTRLTIPAPLTSPNYPTLCNVIKTGQDILVNTLRGVISLASVMAGKDDQTGYYALSRNLGPVITGAQIDISFQVPFAYFAGELGVLSNEAVLYVLNYERGAWSRLSGITSNGESILAIVCQSAPSSSSTTFGMSSYVLFSTNAGKIFKISESASFNDSGTSYVWQSPFLDFETPNKKTINRLNVIARCVNSNTVSNTAFAGHDFNLVSQLSGRGDSKITSNSLATSGYQVQELRPAVLPSQWVNFELAKSGSNAVINEIAGMYLYYEESGD